MVCSYRAKLPPNLSLFAGRVFPSAKIFLKSVLPLHNPPSTLQLRSGALIFFYFWVKPPHMSVLPDPSCTSPIVDRIHSSASGDPPPRIGPSSFIVFCSVGSGPTVLLSSCQSLCLLVSFFPHIHVHSHYFLSRALSSPSRSSGLPCAGPFFDLAPLFFECFLAAVGCLVKVFHTPGRGPPSLCGPWGLGPVQFVLFTHLAPVACVHGSPGVIFSETSFG